ncbi:MAG: histidinol-phosphate transaminase [Vicinamibacterales bacterium]
MLLLNQNENPYGISEAAEQAIVDALGWAHRYPAESYEKLRNAIAERESVTKEHVILGAGSAEILSLATLSYGSEGKEVVAADPGYFDFVDFVRSARGKLQSVAVDADHRHDLSAMERRCGRGTGLVYVCNPHNPTGTIVPGGRLREFCQEVARQAVVAVDEAYFELVDDPSHASMIDQVRAGRKVIVTRTFSKVYGLAGLRIGYGIAPPEVVASLRRIQTNFAPISELSLAAALASYRDTAFVERYKRNNLEVKARFCGLLDRLHYSWIPSQTNFVLFQVRRPSTAFAQELRARSILVRPYEFGGRQWIRASIGLQEEMDRLGSELQSLA